MTIDPNADLSAVSAVSAVNADVSADVSADQLALPSQDLIAAPADSASAHADAADAPALSGFALLGLAPHLLRAIEAAGYDQPTPIQAQAIPLLLEGRDMIGQAQTGTGKTAAFALPLLQNLNLRARAPQALVLAPTRELAIQVATAVESYGGQRLEGRVALLYGGQPIGPQLGQLARGPAVVVGTPGRVIDHLERGSLSLAQVSFMALDEADEMLKMGFIDDVELILSRLPTPHQTALFSATMPPEVKAIADRHLSPERALVRMTGGGRTSDDVEQRFLAVPREGKVAALAALLELQTEGIRIIFARTRKDTSDLVDTLSPFGHRAEALNGEMNQNLREAVLRRLRDGSLNTLVATDVAARGLDIEGVSLVVNFDLPHDSEAYIHRIGRTGRAGQQGRAVTLVGNGDRRAFGYLQQGLSKAIPAMEPITPARLLEGRKAALKAAVAEQVAALAEDARRLAPYLEVAKELTEGGLPAEEVLAAALALSNTSRPLDRRRLPIHLDPEPPEAARHKLKGREPARPAREQGGNRYADRFGARAERPERAQGSQQGSQQGGAQPTEPMVKLQISAGAHQGVRPKDIVGAIANECGVEGRRIGAINIEARSAFVEVPREAAERVIDRLNGRKICGVPVRLRAAR